MSDEKKATRAQRRVGLAEGTIVKNTTQRVAELLAIIAKCNAEIESAYWLFSRSLSRNSQPPSTTVPNSYTQRRAALDELKAMGARKPLIW